MVLTNPLIWVNLNIYWLLISKFYFTFLIFFSLQFYWKCVYFSFCNPWKTLIFFFFLIIGKRLVKPQLGPSNPSEFPGCHRKRTYHKGEKNNNNNNSSQLRLWCKPCQYQLRILDLHQLHVLHFPYEV